MYQNLDEITNISTHINSKLQTNAYRIMRAVKLACKNKEELSHEELMETMLIIQLLTLNYFLNTLYQIKSQEEEADRRLTRCSDDFTSFAEMYDKFWKYHQLEKASGENLNSLKKSLKDSMDQCSNDNASSRKRVRKSESDDKRSILDY